MFIRGSKCSYVELKYQGARFARKWNVCRFSGLRRAGREEKTRRRGGSRFAQTTRRQVRMAGSEARVSSAVSKRYPYIWWRRVTNAGASCVAMLSLCGFIRR